MVNAVGRQRTAVALQLARARRAPQPASQGCIPHPVRRAGACGSLHGVERTCCIPSRGGAPSCPAGMCLLTFWTVAAQRFGVAPHVMSGGQTPAAASTSRNSTAFLHGAAPLHARRASGTRRVSVQISLRPLPWTFGQDRNSPTSENVRTDNRALNYFTCLLSCEALCSSL